MTTAKITEWDIKVLLPETDEKHLNDLKILKSSDFHKRPNFTAKEKDFLSKLPNINKSPSLPIQTKIEKKEVVKTRKSENTLSLNDITILYNKLHDENDSTSDKKLYLHEILENAQLIIPENEIIPRNPQLEERCRKLRLEQDNVEYANMTKNVDSARKTLPEDTISYQIKSLNKQLIAVFQFVVSVVTGFAFGFIGLELIFGGMEFGFRLLLGIICALIIALAEIYFLAKKLNEYDEFIDSPKHAFVSTAKKNN